MLSGEDRSKPQQVVQFGQPRSTVSPLGRPRGLALHPLEFDSNWVGEFPFSSSSSLLQKPTGTLPPDVPPCAPQHDDSPTSRANETTHARQDASVPSESKGLPTAAFIAKPLYGLNCIGGSNPPLSAISSFLPNRLRGLPASISGLVFTQPPTTRRQIADTR
jgi:hypothetical protein